MMHGMDILALAQSAFALFAIVDPVGVIPLFLLATRGYSLAQSRAAARLAAITVFVVLLLSAYGGQIILDFFGIRLAAFSVAGGLLLLLLALSMVQAHVSPQRQTQEEAVEAEEKDAVGVVPLGVPLLAGPGAITHMIVAAGAARGEPVQQAALLIPVALVALSVWLSFRAAPAIERRLGRTGIHVVTRLMGLIIAAISIEMIASGLGQLFPGLLG
ncbi:MAG: antibiotic resistance protein MarC [Hydrogenophilales bacterium 16-64-46]|nr:MAG: antibiotic resistance protein MarC [Hydrogenophilales bacterium 12-64-13]OYZ05943.1 MAG: antibiotic resistance protein MarC [Hydrogenophilales bacterium 16-64-46]OZA39879.1 MAG: antibiotic resistance protein MarC [Hydrogenophilales bacterium 17-64-34]